MRVKLCGLLLLLLAASICVAQEQKEKKPKPDFTGVWMREPSREETEKKLSPSQMLENQLLISHQEPEIKFTYLDQQGDKRETIYYTDGRGEENAPVMTMSVEGRDAPKEQAMIKSKTKWEGDKLVMRASSRYYVAGHFINFEIAKEWKLSKDGSKLTETTRTKNTGAMMRSGEPAMANEDTRVYHRSTDK